MALIKCRDCEREISSDVLTCFHCGAVQKEEFRQAKETAEKIMGSVSKVLLKIFK